MSLEIEDILSRKSVVLQESPLFQRKLHQTEDELSSNSPRQSQTQDQILYTKHTDTVVAEL